MLSGQYPVYLEKGKFSTGPFDNLLVGLDDGTSQIWLSNGDGSFTFGSTAPGGGAISLRANGRDDLVAEEALLNTHQLVVWLSNPDGSFQAPAYYSAPAGDIVPGVFNNDGHVDLAFISPEKISIVFGNGDGTFQNGNYFTVAPPNRYTFDVAEGVGSMAGYFDGTANLGLAAGLLPINWQTAAPSLAVLNGNSNGTLQTPVVYPGVWIGFGSTASDVNNDGYSDILSVGPGCIFDDCHGSETALYEVLLNEEVADTSASIANITIDPTTASHPLTCSYAGDTSYTGSTSNTVTESFVQLATPVFSLRVGKFTGPQTVSISGSRTGTSYYYTTDGSTPTTSSTLYTGPFVISTTTTLRAIGVQAGYINSNVSEAIYTFAATPQFTPPPGQYSSAQTVTITDSTSGSTIFYTTDGSTPTPLSATYTAPVALPANATLKAMAIAPRHLNSSAASGTYSAPAQTTTTALKASAISVAIGASVTLTATVTGSSPTGSVTFMAGSKALGTVTVSKGAAALKSSFDTAGTYSITANYSGDANNASSSSAAVSITVTAPTPTYTVSATPASQSITAGQSATYKITVTPANGYSASTSFDCSGAPSEAKCSFSPASVAPNGGPVSTTLTISTTAPQAMLDRRPGKDGPPWRPVGSLALAGLVGLFFAPRRARRWRALLRALSCMLLLVSAAMAVTGCGGGGNTGGGQKDTGTPKGSYSVTVNASGTSNQSLKLTLVVK